MTAPEKAGAVFYTLRYILHCCRLNFNTEECIGEDDEIPRCAAEHKGWRSWTDNRKISHWRVVVLLR